MAKRKQSDLIATLERIREERIEQERILQRAQACLADLKREREFILEQLGYTPPDL